MPNAIEVALNHVKKPRFVLVSDLDHTMVSVLQHLQQGCVRPKHHVSAAADSRKGSCNLTKYTRA
jgi:hypothetical protein